MRKKKTLTTVPRVSTSFKVSEGLREEIKVAAARERREMGDLVEDALRAYLAKSRGPK
jgi:hypothetical protein